LLGSGLGLILRYYTVIRLERLRKTMKNLTQDSWSPGPRFEPRTLPIRRSVAHSTMTFIKCMARPQIADGEGLQTWSIAAIILNK
jgi:hypothetical protein